VERGRDHDPPAKAKLPPIGIPAVATGALMPLLSSRETGDTWADALPSWWRQARAGCGHIKRLVVYLDDGPRNSGRRARFLGRMVQLADASGLEIRPVYHPPDHSEYNRVERCWSAPERKWNGVLVAGLKVVGRCAVRMTWKGRHPTVRRPQGSYRDGFRVPAKERKGIEARLRRSATLPDYAITIKPARAESQGQ
jgi:hypothetical protein